MNVSKEWFTTKSIITCIVVSSLLSIIVVAIVDPSSCLKYLTCNSDGDELPDFVEILIRSYQGNPYEQGSTYMPLCFLIFRYIDIFLPGISNVSSRSIDVDNSEFIPIAAVFAIVLAAAFYVMFHYMRREIDDRKMLILLVLLMIFGSASFWIMERGNIIFMSTALLFVFLFNYSSESKNRQFLAILCLVVAVSIKPYCVFFALLLLKEKKYSDIVFCIVLMIILNVVAILCFGGIGEFATIFHNMFALNDDTSFVDGYKIDISNTLSELILMCGGDYHDYSGIISIVKYAMVFGLFISIFYQKNKWKLLMAFVLLYIMFSNVSWIYLMLMMLLPLTFMLKSDSVCLQEKINWNSTYLIILVLSMVAFPIAFATFPEGLSDVTLFYLIPDFGVIILSLMIIYESLLSRLLVFPRLKD